jgi:hypothetical protein
MIYAIILKELDGKLNFNENISKLSKDRATSCNDWFFIGVALIIYITVKLLQEGNYMICSFYSGSKVYNAGSIL